MSDLETRLSQALTLHRAMERALYDPRAMWELEYGGQRHTAHVERTPNGVRFSAAFDGSVHYDAPLILCVDGDGILATDMPGGTSAISTSTLSMDLELEGEPAEAA